MKAIFICLAFLGWGSAFADASLPSVSKSLFSLENLPGKGSLNFVLGQQNENLEFGKDKSFYTLALVFERKNLPASVAKTITKHQVIQIALGNRVDAQTDRLAQFGAMTLKVREVPKTESISLKCQDLSKADKSQSESAFIIFNSSQTKLSVEDQDKLKNTVFSESGQVKITPIGTPEKILVKHQGKNLAFKRQLMSLTIDSNLSTPFSSERGSLKGTVEVPFFWPSGSESNRLVAELAKESLEKESDIFPPLQAPRTLASPEIDKAEKR